MKQPRVLAIAIVSALGLAAVPLMAATNSDQDSPAQTNAATPAQPNGQGVPATPALPGNPTAQEQVLEHRPDVDTNVDATVDADTKADVRAEVDVQKPGVDKPDVDKPDIDKVALDDIHKPQIARPEIERPQIERPEVQRPDIQRPEVEMDH